MTRMHLAQALEIECRPDGQWCEAHDARIHPGDMFCTDATDMLDWAERAMKHMADDIRRECDQWRRSAIPGKVHKIMPIDSIIAVLDRYELGDGDEHAARKQLRPAEPSPLAHPPFQR